MQIYGLYKETVVVYIYNIIMRLLVIIKNTCTSVNIVAFSNLVSARVMVFSSRFLDMLTLFSIHAIACMSSEFTTLPLYFICVSKKKKGGDYKRSVNFVCATVCSQTMPPHGGTHTDDDNSCIWRSARLES